MPLNRRYRYFTRVAGATQFFSHADSHHAALIHKIHGCMESYRVARQEKNFALSRAILPSLVCTFREIQNWGEDSWSHDYLTTLLRTRTVVFAGYSAVDPVIHDTFRSVYEEMASYKLKMDRASGALGLAKAEHPNVDDTSEEDLSGKAPAFFLDLKPQFHGLEILRAASMAAGDFLPELANHPNLLTFHRSDETAFPHLDELFSWLFHLTFRELQNHVLEKELRWTAYQLLGGPCPEEEAKSLIAYFTELRGAEREVARKFDSSSNKDTCERVRRSFQRMTAWTQIFHVSLLPEYALAQIHSVRHSRRRSSRTAGPSFRLQ